MTRKAPPRRRIVRLTLLMAMSALLGACAVMQQAVIPPEVRLDDLQLVRADWRSQEYAVTLGVLNPNGFSLPIRDVRYRIELAGRDFAGGTLEAGRSLPAGEEVPLAFNMTTDLLDSAWQVMGLLSGGGEQLEYRIHGEVEVNLPGVRAFPFEELGTIQISR